MKEWEAIFPEPERRIYEKARYGGKQEFGQNPALLIIDVTLAFVGTRPVEILDAIDEFPSSCGKVAWKALPKIKTLLEACRGASVPIVFTTGDAAFKAIFANVTKRSPAAQDIEAKGDEIPEVIKPRQGEYVVRKARASAFFGTHLITYLIRKKVDSLLITGTTTSGCVRATSLDAFSFGLPAFLVEDCIFDRSQLSHLVNLYEMNSKYGTVISLAETLELVRKLDDEKKSKAAID
jgi:nicotinamidase-related amidase